MEGMRPESIEKWWVQGGQKGRPALLRFMPSKTEGEPEKKGMPSKTDTLR